MNIFFARSKIIRNNRAALEKAHVIAISILVSFHSAFISSLASISDNVNSKSDVLKEMFGSTELLISILMTYLSYHISISVHELAHYIKAAKLNALPDELQKQYNDISKLNTFKKIIFYCKAFLGIPWGLFRPIEKTNGKGLAANFHLNAPYNLAVNAAGPAVSGILSSITLPIGIALLAYGLVISNPVIIIAGRAIMGIGWVTLFDRLLADPKELSKFKNREKIAAQKALEASKKLETEDNWFNRVADAKLKMIKTRIQYVNFEDHSKLKAPWGFRNSGMGGRHTEKQYPESNLSMQEAMFIPLSAKSYEQAQEMTVSLQNRLMEIIQKAEGCTVKGIGLEGGLATYIAKEPGDRIPEQRLWRMMKQAILDLGYLPGTDIVLALDPAMSELENAYKEEKNQPDAVGSYLFWRDADKIVMTRDEVIQLYKDSMLNGIPIVSIEDGAAEDDHEGWKMTMKELGDRIFVIGDDSVTTRDSAIEYAADTSELNTFLCKANQIGTLSETIIALLVAYGKKVHAVVSHRSQSPNDPFEAEIAMAFNALGLKAGGGANTERLIKYGRIIQTFAALMNRENFSKPISAKELDKEVEGLINKLVITDVVAYEDNTNSGNPTVRVDIHVGINKSAKYGELFTFSGSTPLGTSAGTGEAIHLTDSTIAIDNPTVEKYPELFSKQDDGSYIFKKGVKRVNILEKNDRTLTILFENAERYSGKGCKTAVTNVKTYIKDALVGKKITDFVNIRQIDTLLLELELLLSQTRKESSPSDSLARRIEIMQRKGNLGMNAILSVSLAMARLVSNMHGKNMWELIRDEARHIMIETISRTLTKENVSQIFNDTEVHDIITKNKSLQEVYAAKSSFPKKDIENYKFEDLVKCLILTETYLKHIRSSNKKEGFELYTLLRDVTEIYNVPLKERKIKAS